MGKRFERFILIENTKIPIIIGLNCFLNGYGYLVCNGKQAFTDKKAQKIYPKLIKKGLFKGRRTESKEGSNIFPLHRLITCIYEDIYEYEIHHIDKTKKNNYIRNLVKAIKQKHDKIHRMSNKEGQQESFKMQAKLKSNLFRKIKNTLAQRPETILEILQKNIEGLSVEEIEEDFKSKIKKSKIHEILNYFHYKKDFSEWLKKPQNQTFPDLNGKFDIRWEHILKFEGGYEDVNNR